jgi:hypothetical protein
MWVLATTTWIGVVIVGSALTWFAIDRAGQQVTSSSASSQTTQPAVVGTIGSPPIADATPSHSPSAGSTPSRTPTRTTTSAPTHAPTKTAGSSPPKASSPPPARTEIRTWSGSAGSVTVSCTGRTVRFKGASPNDGWHVERGDDSGGSIEVKFEKNETEVQVQATCSGGVPRFHVETSGGDD